ncbi:MAG: hypothetical protein R6X10_07875 [Desulfobacterales bacterium]
MIAQKSNFNVFYVSSHGLAGDHWFDWFAKALNAHPEIMIYIGETVRSKYLKERSRKDRPNLLDFTKFLIDFGAAYEAVGECYAYRSYQLEALWKVYGDEIRFINLARHPYCWLEFYTTWRCSNMNMPPDDVSGVDHEWNITCHDEIKRYNLRPYKREDVKIWSFYQGLIILNRMISDLRPGVKNVRIEQVVSEREKFAEVVDYLTHGRIVYERPLMDLIYSWVNTPFRKTGIVRNNPEKEYAAWPDWKREAFLKIVREETIAMFEIHGYTL